MPLVGACVLAALLAVAGPAAAGTRPGAGDGPADSGPAGGGPASARPGVPPGWRLVWRDDFDGPAGSRLDPGSWLYDLRDCYPGCPAPNWGTGEVAEMTDSPDNVALDGEGHLLITPRRDPADPSRWTSGRVETRRSDFAAPDHGALRIEARLALPTVTGPEAKGYWSAFWTLGSSFRDGYADRTGAGDLDVMEHVNDRPETVGAVHCQPVGGGDPCHEIPDNVGLAGTTTCPPVGCLTGFHTYTVEVHRESVPERIDWLVDGTVYHTVRADQPGMDASTWQLLVERSFFLILNQSIGGGWPGSPTAQTRSGAPLVVDHVAVWVTDTDGGKEQDHKRSPEHDSKRSPDHDSRRSPDHDSKHGSEQDQKRGSDQGDGRDHQHTGTDHADDGHGPGGCRARAF